MSGLPPIPVTEREDSMRLLYLVLDDANHTFGPPIPKGQNPRFLSVSAGVSLFIVMGIFFGIAIGLTRDLEPIQETTRQQLQDRISMTQTQLVETQMLLEEKISTLSEIRQGVDSQSAQIRRINENINLLNTQTGYTELRGDGVRVIIQSSVNPSLENGVDLGVVIDSDISRVVNGLFSKGAIAVSVNGNRITSNTAIRSAGEAILVGYQPLSPPYEILAIGDPDLLARELKSGRTGEDLKEISSRYGVRFSTTTVNQITIPASITPLRNRVAIRILE